MRQKLLIFLLCACVLAGTAACGKTAKMTEEQLSLSETTETTGSFTRQLAGTYYSRIAMSETMGVDLYLRIGEDGTFVFARDTQFGTDEKGAGTLTEDTFVYTVLNGEAVEDGTRNASYTVDPDGSIRFTSPMWFGATEPKFTADDGSVTYPVFSPIDVTAETTEEAADETESFTQTETTVQTTAPETKTTAASTKPTPATRVTAAKPTTTAAAATTRFYGFTTPSTTKRTAQPQTTTTTTKPTTTAKPTTATTTTATTTTRASSGGSYTPVTPQTTTTTTTAVPQGFREGTYRGSTEKYVDAMQSTVHYDVTVTFSSGQYSYTVQIRLTGGMEYSGSESYDGTYTLNGNTLSLTGNLSKGSVSGNSIDLTGKLSSFASESDSVTVTR